MSSADVGTAALVVGFGVALYAIGAGIYAGRTGRGEWAASARRAIYALLALLALAMALLEAAYVRSDFSFELVAQNSSTDTPAFYKLTAMWSSQAGSLLLWVFLLSLFSSAVLFLTRRRLRDIAPYATAVLGGVAAFFLFLMLFYASPFATLAAPPAEGSGLNPLLRHPAMMFHPPMLYTGYVGFTIPFAFAVGALLKRHTGPEWIRATRRFALVAWTFLGFGILLGALWSYSELGWGGYWAWDPVENASLMPWLTGTAFIHSIMVQEKRGMLRIWNASLIVATFMLALLGTFLVRSGILDSIHAFGESTLGKPFLAFIAFALVASVALVASRREDLRSDARIDALMSREVFFLLNNLVLILICVVIFWGTFFPLISEAITGTEESVGPPFFNKITTPLALALVALAAMGPLLTWRRNSLALLRRAFVFPLGAALVTCLALLAFTDAGEGGLALVMFSLTAFVGAVVAQEFFRGARARRTMTGEAPPVALSRLVGRNRRRYGGYIVHVGIAVLLLGVAGSSSFNDQKDVRLAPGESVTIKDFEVTYREPTVAIDQDASGTGAPLSFGAVLDVRDGDGNTFTMRPSRNYYPSQSAAMGPVGRFFEGEATSEVDLRWGLDRDLWLAIQPNLRQLEGPIRRADDLPEELHGEAIVAVARHYAENPPPAAFRAIVSPLVAWIWIGGAIVMGGALLALWPSPEARRRRVTSLYAARLGRELSRA
ncbi:MAG TPA: cytochrome c-type biogenesis CcmF C-terminal domain-containing protein [Thermoleophilaceae bacterium]|nr:cytochrome c-type biogenesis CcmF C-terminal domain-containing protein [Thermoleophilaceae bacterium]